MESEAQKRARQRYQAKTGYVVKLNLNRKGHADIIERLDSVPNKQGYVKALIRKDIRGGDAIADTSAEKGAGGL